MKFHKNPLNSVAFSKKGDHVLFGGDNEYVLNWEVKNLLEDDKLEPLKRFPCDITTLVLLQLMIIILELLGGNFFPNFIKIVKEKED